MKKETTFSDAPSENEKKSENASNKKKLMRHKSRVLMGQTVTEWIQENIYTKIKVPSDSENEEFCIKEVPTKAFGVVDFKGAARKAKAKFVQLSDDTPPEVVSELLTRWKLAKPQILISVTGGAKLFKTDDSLKEKIAAGLRKIAQSPGTWVITGGTNTGIMKFVGEGLQGVTKSLIGIATWGVITNSENLYPNKYTSLGGTFDYESASSFIEKGAFLDHNHTHFLLVDDSSSGTFGKEILFTSRFLKHVTYGQEPKVPSVVVVLEGGYHAIDNVVNAITTNPPIPVVVVKDSGRVANIISYAMELFEESDIDKQVIQEELKKCIDRSLPELKDEEKEQAFYKINSCLEFKDLITIFDANEEEGVDKAILNAIFESYEMPQGQKLQYSLLWNRVDVAQQLIVDQKTKWKKEDFEDAMIMALALNRYKFVELFMENCIGVHRLVTRPLLEFLYGHRSKRKRSIVNYEIDEEDFIPFETKHEPFFQLLKGVVYDNISYSARATFAKYEGIEDLMSKVCDELKLVGNEKFITEGKHFKNDDTCSMYPFRDLFLWAVMNNMQEMATHFWESGEEQIAKAIVAAHINKKLAKISQEKGFSIELVEKFQSNEKNFKELAIEVLDECDSENTQKTKTLLTMQLLQFDSQNCLSLAHAASFEEFIAHTTVQQLLNELWNGDIDFENNMVRCKEDNRHLADRQIVETTDDLIKNGRESTSKGDSEDHLIDPKGSKKNYGSLAHEEEQPVKQSSEKIPRLQKVYQFYLCRPASKFYRNLISYCIFLLLFAYISMAEKKHTSPSVVEIIVFVWIVSLTFEEINQVYMTPGRTFLQKLEDYFASIFNCIDVLAITLYFIAFALQFNSSAMEYGHLIYAIDIMLWIVRLLQFFYASKILGPYVLMIGRMFVDMSYFISILGVFLLAYGVLSTAMLTRERTINKMLRDIVFIPYFNIYGSLFFDKEPSPGMTRFGTKKINEYAEPISFIFLGIFLLISNVLLLNLLIAIFGNTFSKVQEKSDQIWKYNRYGLITEYALKPIVVPPFTIIFHLYKFIKWMFQSACKETFPNKKQTFTTSDIQREDMEDFQMRNVAKVLRMRKKESQNEVVNKKLEDIAEAMRNLQDEFAQMQLANKMNLKD